MKNKDKKDKEFIIQDTEKTTNIKFTILAIIAIILFSAALTPITFQNDTYYTIKIGEHIVNTGTVDLEDPFSWHEGLTYYYPHWLYDVITYLIYNLFGFNGLFITTMILSCLLGVTIYVTNVEISKKRLFSFLVTLGTMYMIKGFIAARAQLVTFILFELEILCIEKFLKTKKIRYGIFLFLIAVLIANIHSAVWPFFFVLVLPYIAEYILNLNYIDYIYKIKKHEYSKLLKSYEKKLNNKKSKSEEYENIINIIKGKIIELQNTLEIKKEKQIKRRKKPYKIKMVKEENCKWLILIMLVCILTGFLTPIKDMPFSYTIRIMQGNTTNSIGEHLPLTLINYKPLMVILAAFLVILIFTDTKIRLKNLFMIAGLGLLMFMTRRQTSMFYIFGGAVFTTLISEFFEKYDKGGDIEFERVMNSLLGVIATILLVILLVIWQVRLKANDQFVSESSYPVQASEYIKENLDLNSIRLYNEYNYGSYLLFKGIPVFIDSRCDLYTPQFNKTEEYPEGRDIFSDYIKTSNISTYYEKTFEKYDITHIILSKKAKLNMLISKEKDKYIEIYEDSNFCIYERINN